MNARRILSILVAGIAVTIAACNTPKTETTETPAPPQETPAVTTANAGAGASVEKSTDGIERSLPNALHIGSITTVAAAGNSMAPNFSWKGSDGNTYSLSDYRGKVVMINFWGTWCPPCRRELPDIVELKTELAEKGFEVLGIALSEQPAGTMTVEQHLAKFGEQYKLNYPLLVGNLDVVREYGGVSAVPTTVIVNGNGEVSSTLVGMQTKARFSKAIQAAM